MFTFEILNIVGACAFFIGAVCALVAAYIYLGWRKGGSTFIHTAIQCALASLVYALMFFDWWWHQRSDGREFPWYRDVALIGIVFLNTWIACVVMHIGKYQSFFVLGGTFAGAAALVAANFCVANIYWWGFSAGVVLYAICYGIIALTTPRHRLYAGIAFICCLILPIGLPLTQMLSWTMAEALDNSPDNINSNIMYLVVTAVGILVSGVVCGLVQAADPSDLYTAQGYSKAAVGSGSAPTAQQPQDTAGEAKNPIADLASTLSKAVHFASSKPTQSATSRRRFHLATGNAAQPKEVSTMA